MKNIFIITLFIFCMSDAYAGRMYDPDTGRFTSRDELGYVDGMGLYNAYFVPNTMDPYGYEQVKITYERYRGIGEKSQCGISILAALGSIEMTGLNGTVDRQVTLILMRQKITALLERMLDSYICPSSCPVKTIESLSKIKHDPFSWYRSYYYIFSHFDYMDFMDQSGEVKCSSAGPSYCPIPKDEDEDHTQSDYDSFGE